MTYHWGPPTKQHTAHRAAECTQRTDTPSPEHETKGPTTRRSSSVAPGSCTSRPVGPVEMMEACASDRGYNGGKTRKQTSPAGYFSHTGNPFDVHLHTGINARRYLFSLSGLSHRTRLLILLSWGQGYEIRHLDRTLVWTLGSERDGPEGSDIVSQTNLLAAIALSIENQPSFDLSTLSGSIAELVAPRSVLKTASLAQQYVKFGYDPAVFFDLMAEQVCRDDQSEMHAYKMQQAAYEEFYAAREELRGAHLVAAAKHAATVARLNPKTVYPRARALIAA